MKNPRPTKKKPQSKRTAPPSSSPTTETGIQLEDDSVQLGLRVPRSLLGALDVEATVLGIKTPGITFTRSDAMRSILTRALNDKENIEILQAAKHAKDFETAEAEMRARAYKERLERDQEERNRGRRKPH